MTDHHLHETQRHRWMRRQRKDEQFWLTFAAALVFVLCLVAMYAIARNNYFPNLTGL